MTMASKPEARPPLVIERDSGWRGFGLGELWQRRELLYFFVWRDLKIRYRQTFFGVAWAVLQPLILMTVFTVILGLLGRVSSDGHPYPLFFYAGLLPWTLFAQGFLGASNSLVDNANILTKVYFPRLLLPAGSVASFILDFLLALLVLIGLSLVLGEVPPLTVVWIVPLTGLTLLFALGLGNLFAALNVRYRDVRYALPFLVQLWLFASPVIYPASLVPDEWRTLYALNPMVGAIEGFRWAFLGGELPALEIAVSTISAIVIYFIGVAYFRRVERNFAEVV